MKHLFLFFIGLTLTITAFSQSQYASSVITFSTEWSPTNWSAAQTLGPPNTSACGDIITAWASASADGAREWLVLGFTTPQPVGLINIGETYNPGAVDTIYLRNASTGVWNTVYTATAAPALPCPRTFSIIIPTTSYNVDAIRIASNSPAVTGWNEIDAVEIQLNCSTSITTTNNPVPCFGDCIATATASASGPGPYSYSWSTTPAQTSQTATALCAGTYTVTVTDANMCTSLAIVTITEPPLLTVSVPTTQVCSLSCDGILTANPSGGTPGYTYLWSPGLETTQTITGLCAGSYTICVTDQNGCMACTTVAITSYPFVNTNVQQTGFINCNGDCTGALVSNPTGGCGTPYTYLWIPGGQTTPSITGLCAGAYTVTVTDNCGCTGVTSVQITQPPLLVVSASATPETCPGCCDGTLSGMVTGGDAPYSFLWTPGNFTTMNVTGVCPGTYTFCVTDNQGCTSCATTTVAPSTLGENEIRLKEGIKIFPNPSSGTFTIEFRDEIACEILISVYDLTGKEVFRGNYTTSRKDLKLDIGILECGIYELRVVTENRSFQNRLIIFKQ